MPKKRFGRYGKHKRIAHAWHFWGLSALSIAVVFSIAVLSRAELRLSGELFAAGDGQDLAMLMALHPEAEVELVRETHDLKLYILHMKNRQYLVEVVKEEDRWVVASVEKLRE